MYYFNYDLSEKDEQQTEPLFKGIIKVRAPKYSERIGYLKQNAQFSKEMPPVDGMATEAGPDRLLFYVSIAKSHIVEVNLTRLSDGFEIKTIDDLEYDKDCGTILLNVARKVIEGVSLGKHLLKD